MRKKKQTKLRILYFEVGPPSSFQSMLAGSLIEKIGSNHVVFQIPENQEQSNDQLKVPIKTLNHKKRPPTKAESLIILTECTGDKTECIDYSVLQRLIQSTICSRIPARRGSSASECQNSAHRVN